MKSKAFERTARTIGVLVLAVSISAVAQNSTHKKFRGVINAYPPKLSHPRFFSETFLTTHAYRF
jgi:hypothetical protein